MRLGAPKRRTLESSSCIFIYSCMISLEFYLFCLVDCGTLTIYIKIFYFWNKILFPLVPHTFPKDTREVLYAFKIQHSIILRQMPVFSLLLWNWKMKWCVSVPQPHTSEQETNANKLIKCHASLLALASMRCMKCYHTITALTSNSFCLETVWKMIKVINGQRNENCVTEYPNCLYESLICSVSLW